MELEGKKVVVTGADGFIGSHLTEALVAHGCAVTAFCFYNSFDSWGWLDSLPAETTGRLNVVMGDIRDPNGVRAALTGADVVFHLAALIGIPFSYNSPDSYVDTNVKGTLNVLQAARDVGLERVVVTSTSEVYGSAQYVPIDEAHPRQAQSPYSASKIGADALATAFCRSFGLPAVIVRICCCCEGGNTSRTRSKVLAASFVWSVPITRCPVSDAVMAISIVSRSRSSPITMISGSSRRAPFNAVANDLVWLPTSRCVTLHFNEGWIISSGSSTMTTWSFRFLFMISTSAARVVVLPLFTGPVTRISPLL